MEKKKKPDLLKVVGEENPIITEELTDITSLASANECTGMGKIFPNAEGEDLDDIFDKASINKRRLDS